MTNFEKAQKIDSVFKVDIKIHFNPLIYKIRPFRSLMFFLNSILAHNFIYVVFKSLFLRRENFSPDSSSKRESSFSHISTTKLIDIDVHKFRLMKGVEW